MKLANLRTISITLPQTILVVVVVGLLSVMITVAIIPRESKKACPQCGNASQVMSPTVEPKSKQYVLFNDWSRQLFDQVTQLSKAAQSDQKPLVVEPRPLWWVDDDGHNYSVEDVETIALPDWLTFDLYCHNEPQATAAIDSIDSFFLAHGFKKSSRNTTASLDEKECTDRMDSETYDYVRGYENNGTRCVITLNPESFANITCSYNTFEMARLLQRPFLDDNTDSQSVTIPLAMDESSAKVSIHGRRSGSFALYAKQNGQWKMIYTGQAQPDCAALTQYNFNPYIHNECYIEDRSFQPLSTYAQ